MNGVRIWRDLELISDKNASSRLGLNRQIVVRPSISRGRGYAVVLIGKAIDQNQDLLIQPAPRTTTMARAGRLDLSSNVQSISDLPDSILAEIFSRIDDAQTVIRCGSICKRWRRLVNSTFDKNAVRRCPALWYMFETPKVKIFGAPTNSRSNIETSSQRKIGTSFREVSIKLNDRGGENGLLLEFLGRLAALLKPTRALLLVDLDLTDDLIRFLFDVWRPGLLELRLFRCSFDRMTSAGVDALLRSGLRHFYIDNCPFPSNDAVPKSSSLVQLCRQMIRFEICFCRNDIAASTSLLDDRFLELVSANWKLKSDIRWIKISNAPLITTDGVINLIARYFETKYGSIDYYGDDAKIGLSKQPNLVLWLSDTSFDADEFLKRHPGRKYFCEDKLLTTKRRKLRDNYGGVDVAIWIECRID